MSVKSFLAVALCASVVGLSLPGAADASERYRGRHHHNHHNNHYNNYGGAAAIGLGLGFLLGNAFAPSYYYGPPPVQYRYGVRPWTREWYDYCSRKYRSFNFRTGYFLGYDGDYHFCR